MFASRTSPMEPAAEMRIAFRAANLVSALGNLLVFEEKVGK